MTDSMIERVASAIAAMDGQNMPNLKKDMKDRYLGRARAAIEAMRPTQEDIKAMYEHLPKKRDNTDIQGIEAYIDAALQEP